MHTTGLKKSCAISGLSRQCSACSTSAASSMYPPQAAWGKTIANQHKNSHLLFSASTLPHPSGIPLQQPRWTLTTFQGQKAISHASTSFPRRSQPSLTPAINHLSSLWLSNHGHLQTRGLLPDSSHPTTGPERHSHVPTGTQGDHSSLTLVGVGRCKNGAVLPLHFLHVLRNFIDEPSNFFHLWRWTRRQVSCESTWTFGKGRD